MALLDWRSKKDRDSGGLDTDSHIRHVRQQLSEQLRCLDARLDGHVTLLGDLHDFYRRRSEVELEYSRSLDKLVRQAASRHKTERFSYSTQRLWLTLLETTRRLARDHGILGELYGGQMSNRLIELTEDVQRIYKKCHANVLGEHEELIKVLSELHSSLKTYQLYHGEWQQAEAKMRHAENQKMKLERQQSSGTGVTAAKSALSRRFRNFEKLSEKKHAKYVESGLKAVKARNEYILCLEAANAAVQKYFSDDIHDLINMMDFGFHSTLSRATLMHVSADSNVLQSRQAYLDAVNHQLRELDQRSDKQAFLEVSGQLFLQPQLFEFQPHRGDDVTLLSAEQFAQDELYDRLNAINERLNTLKIESEEIWKTLEPADNKLVEMTTQKDYDVSSWFRDDNQTGCKSPYPERERQRSERIETESFYLSRFREYQTRSNLMVRLQSKYNCIEKALKGVSCPALSSRPLNVPPKPRRRKPLATSSHLACPKLFGSTIQEYVEATGEDVPLIIRSCVRIINLYGMHHQGVFRIPGPQNEVNEFRNEFESGKDPLLEKLEGKDINSVAGVLKLYFRELKDPLFPFYMFDDLMACSSNCNFNNPDDVITSIAQVRSLLSTLPKSVLTVMRYLFSFLNHVSEFSDENMMDPYNLAICFGPTLLRVPSNRDPVQHHPHIIELIRNILIHQEDIFLGDELLSDGSTYYERCFIEEEEGSRDDSVENLFEDDEMVGDLPTEEEGKEALAIYDFEARTSRELSFRKGDVLHLFEQVSVDWWEGATANNHKGLIPDKYIMVRHRSDSSSTSCRSNEDKFKSTESLPVVKTSRLSVQPSSDDELSSSQPNVCMSVSSAAETEPKSSRVQTPSSGTFTADEEELKGVEVQSVVGETKSESAEEDSISAGSSFDEPGLCGRPRSVYNRWRSLDRCPTSSSTNVRRRSTDNVLESPELSKRVAARVRSADSRASPDNWTSMATPASRLISVPSPSSDTGVPHRTDSDGDDGKSTEDLTLDIDSALAEVMSEIESLGLGHVMLDTVKTEEFTPSSPSAHHKTQTSFNVTRQDFEGAPDLVIGLPTSSTGPQSSPKNLSTDQQQITHQTDRQLSSDSTSSLESVSSSSASQVTSPARSLTGAEVFANANQCTIKKAATGPGQSTDRTSSQPASSAADAAASTSRPIPACRARSVDASTVLTSDGGQRSFSPPPRRRCPVPKAKPVRRSEVGSRPFPTPADITPDVEFVRAIVPPFGDFDIVTRTFTLPRDPDAGRGRPDSGGSRAEVARSMSVGDATAAVDSAVLRPQPVVARNPSPAAKPPVKVKPPVMKKPARAGEVIKRLQESLAQQSGMSVSAPQ